MMDMLKQAQALQSKMKAFQEEMEIAEFVGTAGGGAVTVTVNGKHDLKKIVITPEAASSGTDMLQDLVKAAVNDAGQKANDRMKSEMGRMTGGMSLPGLF
jgi:DNA-binding YbaB/EbfC family protein